MANPEKIRELCFAEDGGLMTKPECRARIIDHLILEDMVDIDEAENVADKFLAESDLWTEEEQPGKDIDIREDLP